MEDAKALALYRSCMNSADMLSRRGCKAALALAVTVAGVAVGGFWWRELAKKQKRKRNRKSVNGHAARPLKLNGQEAGQPSLFDPSEPARVSAPGVDAGGQLKERLTVILTTSPVGRHPSTDLIDEVIGSMHLADDLPTCDMIIVCDGYKGTNSEGVAYKEPRYRSGIVDPVSAQNYESYVAKLKTKAVDSKTSNMKVLELESRHGFGFAVRAALEHVKTPYVLVMQHDRPFTRRCDLPRVVQAMDSNPSELKYVGVPTSTTVGHQYHVLSKYGIRISPFHADSKGLKMLPLIQWYDSTHICQVSHYRGFVFGPRRLVSSGGFIEDKLGQAQLADIRERGVEAAHPTYGTYLVQGDGFSEACVAHLDGRDLLNGTKFRFSPKEDLLHAVQQQAQEVAARLSRSAKSGEPPSVERAAARAAEAARIRMAESLQRRADRERVSGKELNRPADHEKPAGLGSTVPKEVWKEYFVDNSQLKASTPGLGFRLSKRLDDRAEDDASVQWSSYVMGLDLKDGWLKVAGGRYLPTQLDGKRVLSTADGMNPDPAPPPPPSARSSTPPPVAKSVKANGSFPASAANVQLPAKPGLIPRKRNTNGHHEQAMRASSPIDTWEYIDPKGNVQGPFRLAEMQHWHIKGYFPKNLPIRCQCVDRFVPFSELFPPTLVPFHDLPKRPLSM